MKTKIITLMFLFSGCGAILPVHYGSKVTPQNPFPRALVKYKTLEYKQDEIRKDAKVQMWSESRLQDAMDILPIGGSLHIEIRGASVESANTEWWEYIIQDMKGRNIMRVKGEWNVPEYNQYSGWWNTDVVWIKYPITRPFKVFVIDTLHNKRFEFVVSET